MTNFVGTDDPETINGTSGADSINGLGGDDSLSGGASNDTLLGGAGADTLDGGTGADSLNGGDDNDVYYVDNIGDQITDSSGVDEVRTTLASYVLSAGIENLVGLSEFSGQSFTGNGDANTIVCSSANDTLDGGAGADSLAGGDGDDVYVVDDVGDQISDLSGVDEVRTTLASYVLASGLEKLTGLSATGQVLTGNGAANTIISGAGADTLDGGAGNDLYIVNNVGDRISDDVSGVDEVRTSLAAYTLTGTGIEKLSGQSATGQALTGASDNNTILGFGGNDTLDGGGGADTLIGQAGNDVYIVDNLGDQITGEISGVDEVRTTLASYVLSDGLEKLTGLVATGQFLTGNGSANTITGGSGNDTLDGGVGADILIGGAGDDVYLFDGSDQISDASGVDEVCTNLASYTLVDGLEKLTGLSATGQFLVGNGSANTITGGAAADLLNGGGGDDVIISGGGADTMIGGAGGDIFIVNDTGDQVSDASGLDEVRTTLAVYTLPTGLERLTGLSDSGQWLTGSFGADTITGGAGNDTLYGGGGSDILIGGAGDDIYLVDGNDQVSDASGVDEVRTVVNYVLADGLENLTGLSARGLMLTGNGSANTIAGDSGNDTLDGGGGSDSLLGGAGDDVYLVGNAGVQINDASGVDEVRTALASYVLADGLEKLTGLSATGQALTGNAGDNTIAGGSGADTMDGGAGDDVYIVDNAGDLISDASGIDEVRTAFATYALGSNLEKLTGLSGAGQSLTGNGDANTITGGDGNDTLDGGAGADSLAGGAGDDVYLVDNSGDQTNDASGVDEVRTALASYVLANGLEKLTGLSAAGQVLIGNGDADTITGGDGNDILDGAAGADSLTGGAGNDIYLVDNVGDQVSDASGVDEVRTTLAAYTLGSGLERLTGLSASGQSLTGNGDANTMWGGSGDDTLDGGAGADSLVGGAGNDVYMVDVAGDRINEASGVDEVRTALAKYALAADLEKLTGLSATGQVLTGNAAANTITGGSGDDTVEGGLGADSLTGGLGVDTVIYAASKSGMIIDLSAGTASGDLGADLLAQIENVLGSKKADVIIGDDGANSLEAGGGNDTLEGGAGSDQLFGGGGLDTASYAHGAAVFVDLSLTGPQATHGGGNDTLVSIENLIGSAFADRLTGSDVANRLDGGAGDDTLTGGAGKDVLAGGDGADVFRFLALSDSTKKLADLISDLGADDRIDLSAIDADAGKAGNQAFHQADKFTHTAGELVVSYNGTRDLTTIQLDVDGDARADMTITISGDHADFAGFTL